MLNILLTKSYWAAKQSGKQMAGGEGSGLKTQELVADQVKEPELLLQKKKQS